MALIKCTECGKDFSDKAPACPNCGCPTDCIVNANPIAENDTPDILQYIYDSYPTNRVAAIKEYRKATGCSLSEGKKLIDNYYDSKIKTSNTPNNPLPNDKFTGGLKCPKCKGHNIDLWSNTANMEEFQRTGLNLNPLHPLTPFKTKTVKKEKKSAAKIGLGMMTLGTSLLVTGTKNKKHNEYYCRDCGNRWIGK